MPEKTLQEALVEATEREYHWPILEQLHQEALHCLKEMGISVIGPSKFPNYYNRIEEALAPPLTWRVGQSELRVYLLLVTEEISLEGWKSLGWKALSNADPFSRILVRAFDAFWMSRGITKISWDFGEVPGGGRFLRVPIVEREIEIKETHVRKKIVSYLRFYRNSHPRPHGRGEAIPL